MITTFSEWLAELSYFWAGLVSFEIVISFFYTFTENGRPQSRWGSKHFQGTRNVTIVIIILATLYFFGESFLHKPIVDYIASLGTTTLPISVFSVAFFAFYTAKVIINSSMQHRFVVATLAITLISLGISIAIFLNGNKLW